MPQGSKAPRDDLGLFDIPGLGTLVAAVKQNDQHIAAPDHVKPIAWPGMNSQLADTLANRPDIPEQTSRQAGQPGGNRPSRLLISQRGAPGPELNRFDDLSQWIVSD